MGIKDKTPRIVIIGNGFDLAHGLKSSYKNFIDHVINMTILNSTDVYQNLITSKYTTTSLDTVYFKPSSHLNFTNDLFMNLFKNNPNLMWCNVERIYFQLLKNCFKETEISKLNSELNSIKDHLVHYLIEVQKLSRPITSYRILFDHIDNRNTLFINFNYTNTLDHYTISNSKIIHIHGKLTNKEEPIIFGYAANQDEMKVFDEFEGNEVRRNIKKMNYNFSNSYDQLEDFISDYNNISVMILGHSIGLSDKQILKDIFSKTSRNDIKIFYNKTQENYFQILSNIDRVIDSENSQRLVTSFNKSFTMPQIEHDNEFENKLYKYLKENI